MLNVGTSYGIVVYTKYTQHKATSTHNPTDLECNLIQMSLYVVRATQSNPFHHSNYLYNVGITLLLHLHLTEASQSPFALNRHYLPLLDTENKINYKLLLHKTAY